MKKKSMYLISTLLLLFSLPLYSQTYLDVAPGYGTLNDALNTNGGDVIYRLEAGGWYGLNGIIENSGFPLSIEGTIAEEGEMYATIQTGTNADGTVMGGMFSMIDNVTLKNLHLVNADMNGNMAAHMFWSASPISIKLSIDNCVIDPAGFSLIRWVATPHPSLFITNSQIINNGDLNSLWNGNTFDTSPEPRCGLDTLYFENNTFLSTGMLISFNSQFNTDSTNVVWINHNSFLFHKLGGLWQWRMDEYFVTNNLFYEYNTCALDAGTIGALPDPGIEPDDYLYAMVLQDTAYYDYNASGELQSDRKLFVQYNSNYTDPRLWDFYYEWLPNNTVDNDGVTPIKPSYLTPLMYPNEYADVNREAAMSVSSDFPNMKQGNYMDNLWDSKPDTDPQFNDNTLNLLKDSIYTWAQAAMKTGPWGFNADNVVPMPADAGDWYWHADPGFGDAIAWPRIADASYKNSALLTASIEGLPLGDLNWFPESKAIWKEHQEEVKNHIVSLNENQINITAVDETPSLPVEFKLSQNYPNPFNPSTEISYIIPESGVVSLKVYNVVGQEVAVLVNEKQEPGNYSIKFDASNLSTGVYMYKIQVSGYSATMKMLLLK